ncbi:MAG: hypothetical protein ABIN61_09175 [candidate division WOR-3 bacterium]
MSICRACSENSTNNNYTFYYGKKIKEERKPLETKTTYLVLGSLSLPLCQRCVWRYRFSRLGIGFIWISIGFCIKIIGGLINVSDPWVNDMLGWAPNAGLIFGGGYFLKSLFLSQEVMGSILAGKISEKSGLIKGGDIWWASDPRKR